MIGSQVQCTIFLSLVDYSLFPGSRAALEKSNLLELDSMHHLNFLSSSIGNDSIKYQF